METVLVSPQSLIKQGLPSIAIAVLEKNVLSVIAPQDDMIETASDEQPWLSRHPCFLRQTIPEEGYCG
jgi:hypothetical protein